nr:formylglycine-generating enzyme family protein [Planctomycetota bacterium]
ALAHLDQPAAFAAQANERLAEFTALVGGDDAAAARWNVKARRVGELKNALAELPRTYVLPAEAPAQVEELIALLGPEERDCAAWAKRIAILTGPPAPTWAAASGRDPHGLWADLKAGKVVQRFRYVPAGTFTIGSPDKEPGREKDETRCPVTLTQSFWLADSECVQGLWDAIGVDHGSRFVSPERPVERVSRLDCQRFLDALNRTTNGLDAKLPTEAQWEYACRAGSSAPYASWAGEVEEKKLETVAWSARNATSTKEVKRRQPNTLGLFDMHGNVWEWCGDRYGTYSPTAISDPVGREEDTYVARGGSWGDQPVKLRAANRLAAMPDLRTLYVGMRILVPAAPVEGEKLAGNP